VRLTSIRACRSAHAHLNASSRRSRRCQIRVVDRRDQYDEDRQRRKKMQKAGVSVVLELVEEVRLKVNLRQRLNSHH